MNFSTVRITFIAVVAVLAAALFAAGIWAVNKQREIDENDLQQVKTELTSLENRLSAEIARTQDSLFVYSSPESIRTQLDSALAEIQKAKRQIATPEASSQKAVFTEKRKFAETTLAAAEEDRNKNTGNFVLQAKGQISKYKGELDKAMKQNRYLSAQLAKQIKEFKGAKVELEQLKAEKQRLDAQFADQNVTRSQLDSLITDRNELRELLAKAQRQIAEQQTEINRLSQGEDKLSDFDATYLLKDRQVSLNDPGKSATTADAKEITIKFKIGKKVFEPGDDQIIYLTLYDSKNNPVVMFKNQPITVKPDAQGFTIQKFQFAKRLDKGDYLFRATHKERQLMPDYKFTLRGSLF